MARRLRIAASMFFGVLTVTLIGMWVRSYSRIDTVWFRAPFHDCCLTLAGGTLDLFCDRVDSDMSNVQFSWRALPLRPAYYEFNLDITTSGFLYGRDGADTYLILPYWFVVCVPLTGMLFAIATTRRYSLRTLLITTTLVAVVLGLVAWVAR